MLSRFLAVILLAGVLAAAHSASAAPPTVINGVPISPFTMIGYIQKFELKPDAGPTSGGTMTVNGIEVIIPDNLVIVMPASLLTPYDIFQLSPYGVSESGLALDDPHPPIAAFEVSIVGNIVGDKYIAGQVTMAQELAFANNGYITRIDYSTGEIYVSSTPPGVTSAASDPGKPNTVRLKINDPTGRYGRPMTDQDPRFTVDAENPTVRAETGYPMCIPRVEPTATQDDPLCPATNRPIDPSGVPLTRFVMDSVPLLPVVPGARPIAGSTPIPPCPTCNPTQQVPFMVGDFVTYNGTLARDGKGDYVSAWQLVATAGIFTKPRTDPAYIQWDVGLVGTVGVNVDGVLVEGQDRIRVRGMSTDPTRQVEVYAIDYTGTLRWIGNVVPMRIPFGRFELFVQRDILKSLPGFNVPLPIVDNHAGTQFGAPAQLFVHISRSEALITAGVRRNKPVVARTPILNGAAVPTAADLLPNVYANGLVPDQYLQPVQEYIFPETIQIGDAVTPNNFECLDFLVKGWSPNTPFVSSVGQLSPWPGGIATGANPPTRIACSR